MKKIKPSGQNMILKIILWQWFQNGKVRKMCDNPTFTFETNYEIPMII